jgi:hypothetical protein
LQQVMLWPFSPLCRFKIALVGFGKFQTLVDVGQELLADEPTRVPEQEKQRRISIQQTGCNDYVPKPFGPRQLLTKIRQYLS